MRIINIMLKGFLIYNNTRKLDILVGERKLFIL
jgi:hypothetical protein